MMMTDFMKEATKSFCICPHLDIDFPCHAEMKDTDINIDIDEDEDDDRNVSNGTNTLPHKNHRGHLPPSPPPPPPSTTATCSPTASIYNVPTYEQEDGTLDSGEAKFLLTSTCTFCYKRRNRIPRLPHSNDQYIVRQSKPISLHRLNDTLYCNLITDLQSTLKYRSGWFLLFWLPVFMYAAVSWLVLVLIFRHSSRNYDGEEELENTDDSIINEYTSSWRTLSMIAIVSFIIGKVLYRLKLRNIEDEIHIRVQYEWLPLLEKEGFAINYVIDDPGPFYTRKETYIHIYRINPNVGVTGSTASHVHHTNDNSLIDCNHFRRNNCWNALTLNSSKSVSGSVVPISIISEGKGTATNSSIPVVGQGNEAKYMVFYPMELARRNVDARQIGYSYLSALSSESPCQCKKKYYYCPVGCDDDENDDGNDVYHKNNDDDPSQASTCYYVTPPTLHDLPNGEEGFLLLHEFLYDLEIMTSPSYTIRMLLFVVLFIIFILLCVYAMVRHERTSNNLTVEEYYHDNLCGSFALFGFLLLIYMCERFLRLYTNIYCRYYDVASVVETVWLPQFQLYGYTVTYRIDQPQWYSFREDYVHIYKNTRQL